MSTRLAWIIALVLILATAFWFATTRANSKVSADYQAVTLTNGHTYFGKASNLNGDYVTLQEVYYLESTTPLQQGRPSDAPASDLSLIKLGRELHGPTDKMLITRQNILYIEDLKNDSKVVAAIRAYRNQ